MGGGAPSQVAFRKAAEKVTIGAGSSSGRIAMRNAVEKSMISRSISETAPRVLSLQRDLLRSVPWIKRAYAVIMPESEMRQHISKTFRDKKDMTDVAQVSKMVAYGRMELEETLMLWKGDSHINNFFDDARERSKPSANPSFMDKFLSGRHV